MLWHKSLETGIDSIDRQHKQLFDNIDILKDVSQKDRYAQILEFLGEYVRKHFADEEGMHFRLTYPKAANHKKMHSDFVIVFNNLKNEFDTAGEKLAVLMKINKTVIDWLTGHIMVHDKMFAEYCREREQAKTS